MNYTKLQEEMLKDLTNERLFNKIEKYGTQYLKSALHRHVFPTEEALADLDTFNENLPIEVGDVETIINQLNKNPIGTIKEFKMVDGSGIGFWVEFEENIGTWFFEEELIPIS